MMANQYVGAGVRALAAGTMIFFAASIAQAAQLEGKVVTVADGDTVTILTAERVQTRVRLVGIDAPERGQSFGTRARLALAALAYQRQVTVEYKKKDRYGRILGKLLVNGMDANLEQIKSGMAWHYKPNPRDLSPPDRIRYAQAELEAQAAGRGLWSDRHAVAPWDFRKNQRSDMVEIRHPSTLPAGTP